ncbi:MAG: GntR family transcriptional regulator [Actinomycetota bacterium]|nr:GntR family transcriptional regulator [Actinomycetota bacterium]
MKPPSGTKTAVAYHAIREEIESGRRKQGERLLVDSLRETLEMSPTPIREALRLLEAEGLVVNEPHRGAAVATYDPANAEELYWLRAILEPVAAARAARTRSDEVAAELEVLHQAMVDAVGRHSVELVPLNAAWHRKLYEMANAPALQSLIDQLWSALPVNAMWRSTRAAESVAAHGAITDAVIAQDAEGAAWLMKRHIQAGASRALERLWSDGAADEGGDGAVRRDGGFERDERNGLEGVGALDGIVPPRSR